MIHFTDITRLDERDAPLKHHIGRVAPQDRFQPLTLIEQLITATATRMREEDGYETFQSNPMVTDTVVAPYVTQTLSKFAPADRFNRYELLWLTTWVDTAFCFSSPIASGVSGNRCSRSPCSPLYGGLP